jgi:hypothetical protein
MAFPEKHLWKGTVGWEDRGETGSVYNKETASNTRIVCARCATEARIGRENNKPFIYCPACLVKLRD